MASPTPMGSSHFSSLSRRPPSRQAYRSAASKPQQTRSESRPETRASHYSLNDSSDDEIPQPMKFSALTKALLNDEASLIDKSPSNAARDSPSHNGASGADLGSKSLVTESPNQARASPSGSRLHSPYPRRVVRLSGTPGPSSHRKTSSLSSAVQSHNEQAAPKSESPLDLSTPAHMPRTVRIPKTSSIHSGVSGSSSGRYSTKTNSALRKDEAEAQEQPATAAKLSSATKQVSTIGRAKCGEDAGLPGSMRVKRVSKVSGSFLSGPARRGRRRLDDDEQSPLEGQSDELEGGPSQEPQSQELQAPEFQDQGRGSYQDQEANRASLYSSTYRDFASGSPVSSKDIINSMLRSNSPPPPTLASSQKPSAIKSNLRPAPQPSFKVPAPRPDLPSTHDQENEAPPTFKRNKQAPLLHLDKLEKVPARPQSMDLSALQTATSPERRPLAPRSQNTPRRPAPPPKMSILETATSTAGAATTSHAGGKKNRLKVNGKQFTRLDCIGRGGSSRVYRVMAENSNFFALKRVSLEDADEIAVRGFKGEIDLLKKLESVDRVIRLYDYELNEEKGTLSVVSIAPYISIQY